MKRWIWVLVVMVVLAGVAVLYLHRDVIAMPKVPKSPAIDQTLQASFDEKRLAHVKTTGTLVTYSIVIKGKPSSNLNEFRNLAAETLNDSRGWRRANVWFKEVSSGGNFKLTLSESQYMTGFSSVCSADWSCRVGSSVIINDNRWTGATDAWNAAGGSLRDYRHMVINHEVGHFLGHADNVPVCAGAGELAPLMQQQSMNLRGCKFNPWPLEQELWTRL